MLSAMNEVEDRIKGLKTRVDEYLKPFEPEELLLRIENLIKRTYTLTKRSNTVLLGDYIFNSKENILEFEIKTLALQIMKVEYYFIYSKTQILLLKESFGKIIECIR